MNNVSSFKLAIGYFFISLLSYLIISLILAFITGMPYREVLVHPGQAAGIIMVYWWFPAIFWIEDMTS